MTDISPPPPDHYNLPYVHPSVTGNKRACLVNRTGQARVANNVQTDMSNRVYCRCIKGLGVVGASILGECVFLHRGGMRRWMRYQFGKGRLHAWCFSYWLRMVLFWWGNGKGWSLPIYIYVDRRWAIQAYFALIRKVLDFWGQKDLQFLYSLKAVFLPRLELVQVLFYSSRPGK